MTGASTIRIGLLLPDVLGTYSDTGNAAVLAARARWRGIPTEIVTITADSTPPAGCDVYLLGGGEDTAQLFAADWLRRHRDLHHALDSSARVLAVCAGLQILGHNPKQRARAARTPSGRAPACPITPAPGLAEAPGSWAAGGRRAAMRSTLDAGGDGPYNAQPEPGGSSLGNATPIGNQLSPQAFVVNRAVRGRLRAPTILVRKWTFIRCRVRALTRSSHKSVSRLPIASRCDRCDHLPPGDQSGYEPIEAAQGRGRRR